MAAIAFPTRQGYDTVDGLDRRIAATQEAISMASRLRAGFVVNRVGRVPAEPQGPAWETLTRVLADLANFGQRIGARLAAQTGSESGADLARLLAALPAESMGVDFRSGGLADGWVFALRSDRPARPVRGAAPRTRCSARFCPQPGKRSSAGPRGGRSGDPALARGLEEYAFRGYVVVARSHAGR